MPRRKISRKDLKQPDEFITISAKAIQWTQQYGQQIGYVVAASLVLLLVWLGYRYFDNRSELKAFRLLNQANAAYAAIQDQNSGADKIDETVMAEYQQIIDRYASKDAGKVAKKTLADIYFNTKAYDQAIVLYEKALEDFDQDPFYRALILGDLALAYEAIQNDQKAIQYYQKVVDTPGAPFLDQALFHLAGLYEKTQKSDAAHKLYERIVADHSGSVYVDVVKEKMAGTL